MEMDLIVRGGRVVTPKGILRADIACANGTIRAIGRDLGDSARVIDADGRYVLPGGVDVHAHIEQMSGMGLMNADTFETATRSAAMGGTTSVISFAAQRPGERLSAAMNDYSARAGRGAMIDHAFHIIAADVTAPDVAADLQQLIAAGHRSIKIFTTYDIRLEDRDILEVMAIAREAGALVCVHAENDAMIGFTKDRLLKAGRTHPRDHALSHPRLAEVEAVARMIRFAEFLATPVMLFHISTREALDDIRAARARGVPIWAETCPHYLLMSEDVLDRPGVDGAKWMCSPPQRSAADSDALWEALMDGTLDLVSSDHAPYRFDATGKLSAGPTPRFDQIANGLPGLQTRLPLIFDAIVHGGRGTVEDVARLTATAPARLYGLDNKGAIAPGKDADLVLWDDSRSVTFGTDDLHDNVGYNPWAERTITGCPETVISRGDVIVDKGTCTAAPGQGRWVRRDRPGPTTSATPALELTHLLDS
jgi:dihydropyrimidinase